MNDLDEKFEEFISDFNYMLRKSYSQSHLINAKKEVKIQNNNLILFIYGKKMYRYSGYRSKTIYSYFPTYINEGLEVAVLQLARLKNKR